MVIDGFIEKVDVSRLPKTIRLRIGDVLAPIEGQRGLTLPAIERKLLLRSEQIGLAGTGALSAFDSGLFQGDSGYVARAEAQFPYAWQGAWPVSIP